MRIYVLPNKPKVGCANPTKRKSSVPIAYFLFVGNALLQSVTLAEMQRILRRGSIDPYGRL